MRKIYLSIFTVGLFLSVLTVNGQKHVLFMGRGAEANIAEYQSDVDMIDSLVSWGFKVSYMSNGTYQTGVLVSAFDTIDGCVISETVDSKAMAAFGTTHDYPVPVVCMEGYVVSNTNDRWSWITDGAEIYQTADMGGTENDLVMSIKNNKHYITEVFGIGDEVQWSAATEAADIEQTRPVSIIESEVSFDETLATMKSHEDQADYFNLLVVNEIGSKNNKVVYWGLSHLGLNGADQTKSLGTQNFFTILKRASEWAFDALPPSALNDLEEENYELTSYPNPTTGNVTIQFSATNGQNAIVSLHSITGAQVNDIYYQTVEGTNSVQIDLNEYAKGIYIVKLQLKEDVVYDKIIVE